MNGTDFFQRGRELGRMAFEAGKPAAPVLDNFLRAELMGLDPRRTVDLLAGWSRGWHESNLRGAR